MALMRSASMFLSSEKPKYTVVMLNALYVSDQSPAACQCCTVSCKDSVPLNSFTLSA